MPRSRPPATSERWSKSCSLLPRAYILARYQLRSGIQPPLDFFPLEMCNHRLHAQVSDPKRILHDEARKLARLERFDHLHGAVKSDEFHLPRLPRALQRL